jgi:hypothetical protein
MALHPAPGHATPHAFQRIQQVFWIDLADLAFDPISVEGCHYEQIHKAVQNQQG